MTDEGRREVLEVPARSVPVPLSLSPEARALLAFAPAEIPQWPPLDDPSAWRGVVRAFDDQILAGAATRTDAAMSVSSELIDIAGVGVFDLVPAEARAGDGGVCLDIHGGALVMGGGECCEAMAVPVAARTGLRTWSIDYRMPPDHPYPAALDDCVAVYRALLEQVGPERIVVHGASAGGNLAAALLLRARDEGLPLPAGALLLTPEVDLTESGDSFRTNLGVDTVLTRSLMPVNLLYAGGHDLAHPYLSPLFGDFTEGFPPTFLASGTRDLFLSNTVRMHRALRAAGVEAELHVLEAAPHGFFPNTPEAADLQREIRRFVQFVGVATA